MRAACANAFYRPDSCRLRELGSWVVMVGLAASACGQSDDIIARPSELPQPSCDTACGAETCPCPPRQRVPIAAPSGARFAIDATEVTVADYQAFILARPTVPASSATAVCGWNQSYFPGQLSSDLDPNCEFNFDFQRLVLQTPGKPVACVDWCDARDYCAWAGGHLCGRVGGGGLTTVTRSSLDDEWYVACSAGGAQAYAYGDQFDPLVCNTREPGTVPVASYSSCEGSAQGLFDMNGNADEWVAACDDSSSDDPERATCYRVGGAFFQSVPNQSRCDSALAAVRATHGNDTGIRCCYDP